jgi:hypothetical protein
VIVTRARWVLAIRLLITLELVVAVAVKTCDTSETRATVAEFRANRNPSAKSRAKRYYSANDCDG